MTTDFERDVAMYCQGLETVAVGCPGSKCEYADGDPDHSCEASFSWVQCDSCGSTLGGDRLPAVGLWRDESGALLDIDMEICVDCAMYHANGETPEGGSR
jgi:hypothetical protein